MRGVYLLRLYVQVSLEDLVVLVLQVLIQSLMVPLDQVDRPLQRDLLDLENQNVQ